jgi:hypothetical protein
MTRGVSAGGGVDAAAGLEEESASACGARIADDGPGRARTGEASALVEAEEALVVVEDSLAEPEDSSSDDICARGISEDLMGTRN